MTKEKVEKELEKKFKRLRKLGELSRYSWKEALKLYSILQTEEGNLALKKCIKASIVNSGRLEKDSEVVSGPTKSALLELAFEEASKAYLLSYIYLELFNIKNKPIWADTKEFDEESTKEKCGLISRFILRVKLVNKIKYEMNILYSIFKHHDLKVLVPLIGAYAYYKTSNFENNAIAILKRRGMSDKEIQEKLPIMREQIKLFSSYTKTDFIKIKMQGLYVDFNLKSLDTIAPKEASEQEIGEMKRSMDICIKNAKSLLVALGDL